MQHNSPDDDKKPAESKDDPEALALVEQACEFYKEAYEDDDEDKYNMAIKCLYEAAEKGLAIAQFKLGVMHDSSGATLNADLLPKKLKMGAKGEEEEEDEDEEKEALSDYLHNRDTIEGIRWYRRAADQSYQPALQALANNYGMIMYLFSSRNDRTEFFHHLAILSLENELGIDKHKIQKEYASLANNNPQKILEILEKFPQDIPKLKKLLEPDIYNQLIPAIAKRRAEVARSTPLTSNLVDIVTSFDAPAVASASEIKNALEPPGRKGTRAGEEAAAKVEAKIQKVAQALKQHSMFDPSNANDMLPVDAKKEPKIKEPPEIQITPSAGRKRKG